MLHGEVGLLYLLSVRAGYGYCHVCDGCQAASAARQADGLHAKAMGGLHCAEDTGRVSTGAYPNEHVSWLTVGLHLPLKDTLIAEVRGALGEICVVHGHPTKRLPGNVSFGFEGVDGERLLLALGDLALSSGAACASEKREPSHVLRAMGVPDSLAQATLRVGLGRKNTHEEVQFAAGRIIEAVRSLQSSEG